MMLLKIVFCCEFLLLFTLNLDIKTNTTIILTNEFVTSQWVKNVLCL